MSIFSPIWWTKVSIGVASVAVEETLKVPERIGSAIIRTPQIPLEIASEITQNYLRATHTINDLATRGDVVMSMIFPAQQQQPEWATFDEDLPQDPDEDYIASGSVDTDQ